MAEINLPVSTAAKCCTGNISGCQHKPPGWIIILQLQNAPSLEATWWFDVTVLQPESRRYDRTHWQKLMGSILDLLFKANINLERARIRRF